MEDLSEQRARDFLAAADVGHLAVVDRGKPYVTPMSFVLHENTILLRTGFGRRLEAIRANPDVCVEVSDFDSGTGDWTSVVAEGHAREVDDGELEATAVQLLLQKYEAAIGSPFRMSVVQPLPTWHVVVAIDIDTIGGRSAGGGLGSKFTPGRL
jgi:nitroimidazol reductase NimA-like FMN-containing flavoprotein (pyridoxamine 5'-phosphate oxidase superfamily)